MNLFVKDQRPRCGKILSTFIASKYNAVYAAVPEISNRMGFGRTIFWKTDIYILIIFSETE